MRRLAYLPLHQKLILRILGTFLLGFNLTWVAPIAVAFLEGEWIPMVIFLLIALVEGAIALTLYRSTELPRGVRRPEEDLSVRDGFVIATGTWFFLSLAAAVPIWLIAPLSLHFTLIDAIFEAISGITTTGASAFHNVEILPKSLLIYRALLQWFGGVGIIVLAVAFQPILGKSGSRVFVAEVSGPNKDDKITPHIRDTAKILWLVYSAITLACALSYWAAGMSIFDAFTFAFSTTSTGGFAPYNDSIAHFQSPMIENISIFFMIVGATNFSLHFLVFQKKSLLPYPRSPEFRFFIFLLLLGSGFVWWTLFQHGAPKATLHDSLFQATSAMTSTGFTTAPIGLWPQASIFFMLILGTIGACAGSTTGGLKSIRALTVLQQIYIQFRRLLHPSDLFVQAQSEERNRAILAIWSFIGLYILVGLIITAAFLLTGLDAFNAWSSSATMLNNTGIGFGVFADGFWHASALQKIVASAAMLLGRLEVFTVLICFMPVFWRYNN